MLKKDLEQRLDQTNVQLAGCLTAAEGYIGRGDRASKGTYGWSVAYQKVLELRLAFNKLANGKSPRQILYGA